MIIADKNSNKPFFANIDYYSGDCLHIIEMYINEIKESVDFEKMCKDFPQPLYIYTFGSTCLVLKTENETIIKIGRKNQLVVIPFDLPEILKPKRIWYFSEYDAYEQDFLINSKILLNELNYFKKNLNIKGYSYFDNNNNILKDREGKIKIVDFGSICKITGKDG